MSAQYPHPQPSQVTCSNGPRLVLHVRQDFPVIVSIFQLLKIFGPSFSGLANSAPSYKYGHCNIIIIHSFIHWQTESTQAQIGNCIQGPVVHWARGIRQVAVWGGGETKLVGGPKSSWCPL